MSFVQAGTTPERLVQAVAATADANGLITFRFGPAPLGYVWQGSVTVTNAPSGALFSSTVASTSWGQWAGPTNFGPVQLWGNETLVVAGVGLQPSTQYSMLFFGVSLPEAQADPLPPVAPTSVVSVETTTLLVAAFTITSVNAATGVTFQAPSLTRRVTIIVDATNLVATNTELDLIGTTSKTAYFGTTLLAGASVNPPYFAAIEPNVDQSYQLFMSIPPPAGQSVKVWVLASTMNPMVATNPAEPLNIQGSGTASALPVKAKVVSPTILDPSGANGATATAVLVAGSPVGPYKTYVRFAPVGGSPVTVIAAPGIGQSVYLQTAALSNPSGAAIGCVLGAGGGGPFLCDMVLAPNVSEQLTFPGGLELGNNTQLQAFGMTTGNLCLTYTVGTAL